jgi:hypothetical protein
MERGVAGGFGEDATIFGSSLKMDYLVKVLRKANLDEIISSI